MTVTTNCRVVDIFCGVGGLTHGFVLENFEVSAGIDADISCKYAYETNNKGSVFLERDLRELAPEEITTYFDETTHNILIGCAPCQPFSSYSVKASANNNNWQLVEVFSDLIESTHPTIVSMENVPPLSNHDVFGEFVNKLSNLGYHVYWDIVHAPDYGVPQTRDRLVLLASQYGEIGLIEKTHTPESYVTVRDTIGNMEKIEAGASGSSKDPLHKSSGLTSINLERIRASVPGGTWQDWPERLLLECHKKSTGKSYKSVYGRMCWDEPSPTITTQFYGYGNGRFGHPVQDRAISLREGALLQTFPQDYQFIDPCKTLNKSTVGRHIGNAVPVKLGQVIAKSIIKHIKQLE